MPNLSGILGALEELIPVLGTVSGHPELAVLTQKLIDIGENELQRRQTESGRSRADELADAKTAYVAARVENDKLKALGHESNAGS